MNYLNWAEKKIEDFSSENICKLYDQGYVLTRIDKGVVQQTRSIRVDLGKFQLSSENRRILKKVAGMVLKRMELPLKSYSWQLGKLAKDFYDQKFEAGIMSAQKIKEMLSDPAKSNFNTLLCYSLTEEILGYAICYMDNFILHYSYPFYDLERSPKDLGLGMMITAIEYAKNSGLKYIYLGSLQRPSDTYKLQFKGLEWFDGQKWQTDEKTAKELLKST